MESWEATATKPMDLATAQKRLRRRYLDGLPQKIAVLAEGLSAHDRGEPVGEDSVRRLAHQVAGSAASFGFPELGEIAKQLEHVASDSFQELAALLIEKLEAVVRAEAVEGKRILVVDDDKDTLLAIEECLANDSQVVRCAGTVAEAEAMLAGSAWDVVFLDLVLPDGDGRNILAGIRTNVALHDTPVIVLSGNCSSLVKNECASHGVETFLEKPIDYSVLQGIVDAVVIRHRTYHREAYNDELTQLANRPGFRLRLEPLLALCRRNKQAVSLAILDLDNFKSFNDEYGHSLGDEVLRVFADVLRKGLRESDLVARWGGEEIVVALPETNPAQGKMVLEKLATTLRTREIAPHCTQAVTFSGGITSINDSDTLDLALIRADQLLYAAKRGGRDRVLDKASSSLDTGAKPAILIVEDDLDMVELLRADLADTYEVVEAGRGDLALDLAEKQKFSLIILDQDLPDQPGTSVARSLGTKFAQDCPPIIFLTASGSEHVLEEAFAAGASDYLVKPYRKRELLARVLRHANT